MTEPTTAVAAAPSKRRASLGWRITKWTGIALVSLVVLFFAVLFIPGVKQYAFEQGRSILTEAGVQSESIGGDWTEMTLKNVALTDDIGTWATASEVVLSWSPWGLLSGTIDATEVQFRGARVLRQPAYKPAPDKVDEPFAWPDLPVDITLQALTGDVTLDPAVLGEGLTAAITGKAALTSGGGDAELALTRTDGVPGQLGITARSDDELGNVEISFNAKDARVAAAVLQDPRFANLEVAFQATRDGGTCSGQAAISARDGALVTVGVNPNCTFAVQLPEVARLLDASAGVAGPANLSVQLLEDGTDKTTHFQVAADLSKLVSSDATLAQLLPGASAGALVMFTANGTQISNLQGQLASGRIAFTGAALLGRTVQVKADLNASDLSVLRPDLKGQLQATLGYDTGAALPISFTARGSNIVSGDLAWAAVDVVGTVNATGSGNLTVKADGEAPIDLAVQIADAFGGAMQVQAVGTVASAKLDGTLTQQGGAYAVDASLDTANLKNLGAIANVDVSGALKARIRGTVGAGDGGLALDATISNGRYGKTEIGNATLAASGPLSALNVILSGTAPMPPRSVSYALNAVVSDFSSAAVSKLSVTSASESLVATRPFSVSFAGDILVKDLSVAIARSGKPAGTITADATLTPNGARTEATFQSIDLEALTTLMGASPVKGTFNATASLDGGAGNAKLDGTIEGLRAAGAAGRRVPPATLSLAGAWNGGRVTLGITARAEGLPDATARIAFPMARAAGGGFPSPAPNAPLDGAIDWTGSLLPLWRLADIGGTELDGNATIRATIGGTLSKPEFSGNATVANGSFINDALGTRLVNLNLAANFEGDRVTVKGTGGDGARGTLSVDAATTLGGGLSAASGGVTLSGMQLFARDDLVARIDGALKLGPGTAGPLLSGQLTVTGLDAQIPEPSPPDLVTVDVIDPEKQIPVKAPKPGAPDRPKPDVKEAPTPATTETIALDIDIDIPGPAKVSGRGLDSLWRGNLKVSGDAADPRIRGKLKLMRGQWDFGSRSFALSEGEIEFDGGPTIEPRIDITATQEEDGFTASLNLSGRASAPKITASSVPAAPQDEVFARLLFGRSVANLSPLEGLELANSIAAISGGTDIRGGVLGSIKDRFGLDVLTVDLGEGGATSVKAGRYLTDRVYFELKQGGDSVGTRGRLELQLDDNISVETEVGADSSSSVGGRYRYDY